jgi:hypothetical protein
MNLILIAIGIGLVIAGIIMVLVHRYPKLANTHPERP